MIASYEQIIENSKKLKWNFLGETVAMNKLDLPNSFNELLFIIYNTDNDSILAIQNIPVEALTDNIIEFGFPGRYTLSINGLGIVANISIKSFAIKYAYINSNEESAKCRTKVFYR